MPEITSETSHRPGFELVVALMKRYAENDMDTAALLPVTSEQFLDRFLRASGCPRSLRFVRPAINQFTSWFGGPQAVMMADAATLSRYRQHLYRLPIRTTFDAEYRSRSLGYVARLLLYLQYQGLCSSHGWDGDDADLCIRFRDALLEKGFGHQNANQHGLHAAHLIAWARLQGRNRTELNARAIADFVGHRCACGLVNVGKAAIPTYQQTRRRAAVRFLRFAAGGDPLLEEGVVARATRVARPRSASAAAYEEWLVHHRGLAPFTIQSYMNELLQWQKTLGEDAGTYTATRIRRLARRELEGRSPTAQSRFITVMRSYLRFRASRGECAPALADCLISRPTYSLGTVPRSLPFETLRGVIAACDLAKPAGIRDRALLTLLLETGMRAAEVARLRLQDIDWERALVTVRGKSGQASIMPLTQDSGDAILA